MYKRQIKDIDDIDIDLKKLASQRRLAVITIKTAECPVCQHQLIRIKDKLNELAACNVTFIVLSPGPGDKIQRVRSKTQFPFPFIQDDDLKISTCYEEKCTAGGTTSLVDVISLK